MKAKKLGIIKDMDSTVLAYKPKGQQHDKRTNGRDLRSQADQARAAPHGIIRRQLRESKIHDPDRICRRHQMLADR